MAHTGLQNLSPLLAGEGQGCGSHCFRQADGALRAGDEQWAARMAQHPRVGDCGDAHTQLFGEGLQAGMHTPGLLGVWLEELAAGQWRPNHGPGLELLRLQERAVVQRLGLHGGKLYLVGDQRYAAVERCKLRDAEIRHAERAHFAAGAQAPKGQCDFIPIG